MYLKRNQLDPFASRLTNCKPFILYFCILTFYAIKNNVGFTVPVEVLCKINAENNRFAKCLYIIMCLAQ